MPARSVRRGRKPLDRQLAATDREIDQFVHELSGLMDEEIRIVEEATRAS